MHGPKPSDTQAMRPGMPDEQTTLVWRDLQAAGGALASRCGESNHTTCIPANEVECLIRDAKSAVWSGRAHAAIQAFLEMQVSTLTVAELLAMLDNTIS